MYEGVELHPLYYRSSDGGATWEVTDFIIPGLDSTFMYDLVSADSYYIDARGDVVAIGIFSQWNDITIFKSEDGGDTWESHQAFDFPIDRYQIDDGYTMEDLPPYDTLQPDTMAILSSDNSGHVIIDKNNMVHAFWGQMYIQDTDTTNSSWTFYPGTSGMSYWNESFGPDSSRTIADAVDLNGNDTLDIASIDNIATYFMSLTSMPSASVDEENRIFMIYSGIMEGEDFIQSSDDQHFRHLFLVFSEDDGATWSEPIDLLYAGIIEDDFLIPFIEAIAPHQLRDITGDLQFMYQQDFSPGWSTRGDSDDPETQFINYVTISISDFIVSTEEVVQPEQFLMTLRPNPAKEETVVEYVLNKDATVHLGLYNLMGQQVMSLPTQQLLAGTYQDQIPVSQLAKGVYVVRLQIDNQLTVRKLVVD